jgi:hypothetical protein
MARRAQRLRSSSLTDAEPAQRVREPLLVHAQDAVVPRASTPLAMTADRLRLGHGGARFVPSSDLLR